MFEVRSHKDTANSIRQFFAGFRDPLKKKITKQVRPDPDDAEMVTVTVTARMKKADLPAFLQAHTL